MNASKTFKTCGSAVQRDNCTCRLVKVERHVLITDLRLLQIATPEALNEWFFV